jgi:hypothetical protein
MKKLLLIAAMIAASTSAQAFDGPIAYPGNTWGTLVYAAHSPEGFQKYRIEGIVEQGADWFKFGEEKKWTFNTYGAFEYVINSDTRGITPILGIKSTRAFSDGSLDLGIREKYGNTYLSPTGQSFAGGSRKVARTEIYATYWFAWDAKK